MTIASLVACLPARATLVLDDLQLMQSVCLKLGCQVSGEKFPPVDERVIPANSPVSYSPTPLFSIIDQLHANWNDNQWRHLYALYNPTNEGIEKNLGIHFQGLGLARDWINIYGTCVANNQITSVNLPQSRMCVCVFTGLCTSLDTM